MDLTNFKSMFLAACVLATAGCTVRGYSGTPLPANEIASVTLNTVGEVTFDAIEFDGQSVPLFADNIELPAGRHRFRIVYKVEELEDCDPNERLCFPIIVRGVCEGFLDTRPERSYLITVENKNSLVEVRVAAKGYFDFFERSDEATPGAGTCRGRSNWQR